MNSFALEYFSWALENQVSVLFKMIRMVPDDRVHFRPTPQSQSIAELVCHIFEVLQTHTFAVRNGRGDSAHGRTLHLKPDDISSTQILIEHGMQAYELAKQAIAGLLGFDPNVVIEYPQWDNFRTTAAQALFYFIEELLHHRGQLSVYLRLLDIEPPFLYDFS